MNVKIDAAKMREVESALVHIKNGATTALMRGINTGVRGGKVDAKKLIRAEVTLKAAYIGDKIGTDLASTKNLSGALRFKSEPIPLVKFDYEDFMNGVIVKVWKSGNTQTFPHAFMATVKAGNKGATHTGIYMRTGKHVGTGSVPYWMKKRSDFGALPKKWRLPIMQLRGPTIAFLYEKAKNAVGHAIEVNAQQRFFDEFDRQVDLLIAQAMK